MHLDWGTAAADGMLQMSELLAMVDLGPLARFADAQEGGKRSRSADSIPVGRLNAGLLTSSAR